MRTSASSCICRALHPQLAVRAPAVRLVHSAAPSTSSSLLFPGVSESPSSRKQQQRQASSKAGGDAGADVGAGDAAKDASATSAAAKDAKDLERWLKSEDGQRYKRPMSGRSNWIGRTPFPLNPSFRPPTPLSHNAKEKIYREFVASIKQNQSATGESKSETYHARKLALKYNLALDRVRAIIRLKALEYNSAASGSTLQMKFLNGMESAMGISTGENVPVSMKEALDVQQETEELYKTGSKTHWMMIDEENPDDLQREKDEVLKKERKEARISARRQGGDETVSRDEREGVRSRRRVPGNPRSDRKGVRPEIEFVDVPGRINT